MKSQAERKITPKLLAFVHAYAKTGNGLQSAIAAGYAPKTAKVRAHKLLLDHRVQAELARIQAAAADSAEVEVAAVLRELKKIAFGELKQFTHGKIGVKLADKIRALELLGKTRAMFTEKVEHSGNIENATPVINLTLTQPAGPKADGGG